MKTKTKNSSESPKIGLSENARKEIIPLLSTILANQHVIYLKTRNFHWNLKGSRFHSLHEFFEKQYQALKILIDKTAERIRMLGGASPGSMREFLNLATLKESSDSLLQGTDTIATLRADHEIPVRELREAVAKLGDLGDPGTEDFVTGLLQVHEESAWMLRNFEECSPRDFPSPRAVRNGSPCCFFQS